MTVTKAGFPAILTQNRKMPDGEDGRKTILSVWFFLLIQR